MNWPPLAETADAGAPPPRAGAESQPPFVRDENGIRSLYFSLDELQSRMDARRPWDLEVDYTRTMMGFLMFHAAPRRIGMIGLGGGSLAKFCYRQLPLASITVAEVNPAVVALRRDFLIPDDDARLQVLTCDGADFVAARPASFDVLLVDGFDHAGQPPQLCSQPFYDDCLQALAKGGILAVNLHHDNPDYALCLSRLQRSFEGNILEVPASEKSNCIVFASALPLKARRHIDLKALTSPMEASARVQLQPEFARAMWGMQDSGEEA